MNRKCGYKDVAKNEVAGWCMLSLRFIFIRLMVVQQYFSLNLVQLPGFNR